MTKYSVLHIITRCIVGGAQENTMFTADRINKDMYKVKVLSGPQTGPEGSLIPEFRFRNISLTIIDSLIREIHPVKDFYAFIKLFRYMRRGKYTIVHTHSSKAGLLGRWAAWFAGVPIRIHTVHGWGHHAFVKKLPRLLAIYCEQITARITQNLIVVSKVDKKEGLLLGIGRPDQYITIRSGIDSNEYSKPASNTMDLRRQLGIPHSSSIVGTITRLSPQKAPLDFIAAAQKVSRICPDIHFVLVGDGPLRKEVAETIQQTCLSNRVHLLGLRRDIPNILQMFDLFVLTSLWEGLPRVLLQAMAAGLPIIATDAGGNAEAVLHGLNGFIVPKDNPGAMASSILKVITDSRLQRQMGQAGKDMVTDFSLSKMITDIEKLYFQRIQKRENR